MDNYTLTIESPTSLAFPRKPTLAQIQKMEALLAAMPQGDYPVTHHHAPQVYAREVFIPAGDAVVGKMHRDGHLNVLLEGEIEVWTEEGMKRLTAPYVFASKPGTKRVGYAVTDTRWMTIHPNPTDTTDEAALEAAIIAPETALIEQGEMP